MSFQARIHDLTTGHFLLSCRVEGRDLHEAENIAISQAAMALTGNPQDMDVRHLHQCANHSDPWAGLNKKGRAGQSR